MERAATLAKKICNLFGSAYNIINIINIVNIINIINY